MKIYDRPFTGRAQADGALTLTDSQLGDLTQATKHSLTITKGTATAGTVGARVKPAQSTGWQTLKQNGVALAVNLATMTEPETYAFEGPIDAWEITPTGANGTFDVAVAGWE